MENNESVDSELSEQLNENSTCLENADPVVETGDKLKENKSEEEIRRSEKIKSKPKLSYRFLERCLMNTQICLNDIPNTFDEIKFRGDRTFWEKAIQDELNSHFENKRALGSGASRRTVAHAEKKKKGHTRRKKKARAVGSKVSESV